MTASRKLIKPSSVKKPSELSHDHAGAKPDSSHTPRMASKRMPAAYSRGETNGNTDRIMSPEPLDIFSTAVVRRSKPRTQRTTPKPVAIALDCERPGTV